MNRKKFKSYFTVKNDFALRIYAVLLAILIWFIMSVTLYPTITKTIKHVPVTINLQGTTAEMYHLEPINFDNKTVDVKVSGKRYDIGNLKADNLKATINVVGVNQAGEYELDINVEPKSDKNINIVSITPGKMTINFDTIIEQNFDLQAEVPNITAPTDYLLDTPIVHPKTITIKGPTLQIQRIDKVVVRAKDSGEFKTSQNFTKCDIIIYSGNTTLDNHLFTFNTPNFTIEQPIYKIKTVPLNVETQNSPPGFDLSSLKFIYSESSVQIAGADTVLDNVNDINIGYIDMRNLDLNSSFDFTVPDIAGIKNISAVTKVNLKLDSSNLASKKISISKDKIHIVGTPADYNSTVTSNGIYNITVIGPKEIINKITSDDLIAEIDLSGEEISSNTYSKVAKIYSPTYNTVWSFGTKNVTIKVTAK